MVVSPLAGGEVPLGEGEEQGGPAGLHLGDLLLLPNHHVQVVLPPVPHDSVVLVPLLQLEGRNICLSLCGCHLRPGRLKSTCYLIAMVKAMALNTYSLNWPLKAKLLGGLISPSPGPGPLQVLSSFLVTLPPCASRVS